MGKTELMIHFIAWALSIYPASNFLYISYSKMLATQQTKTIRDIVSLPIYRDMFHVELSGASSAKDNFDTTAGGRIYAAGSDGSITGFGAGIQYANHFGGGIFIDDAHKPDEASSDTIRQNVIDTYYNTIQSRANNPKTPIVLLGQRVHEDDLCARLLQTGGWEELVIPALDAHENPLHPDMHTREKLLQMRAESPYVFAAQYMQDPQPAGGGIFKPDWFCLLDEEPKMLATFITADTAETSKSWNDATAFSFWGIYELPNTQSTQQYCLHWIDCVEIRVEPKDLKAEFMAFYMNCCRYPLPPSFAAIEKKSTGVTLISVLNDIRGLEIKEIIPGPRETKIERFLAAQPYVAKKLVSIPSFARHTKLCIEHCAKITANNTHRHDDIADTLAYAVNIALINKSVIYTVQGHNQSDNIVKNMMDNHLYLNRMRNKASWHM